jgi:Domain of unknown function (DUF4342)
MIKKMNAQFGNIEDSVKTVSVDATTVDSSIPNEAKVRVEELKFNRDMIVNFAKNLIQKGKARYVVIQNKQGEKLIEIPLPIALVGLGASAVVFPVAAIVGTIAVLTTNPTVVVERKE